MQSFNAGNRGKLVWSIHWGKTRICDLSTIIHHMHRLHHETSPRQKQQWDCTTTLKYLISHTLMASPCYRLLLEGYRKSETDRNLLLTRQNDWCPRWRIEVGRLFPWCNCHGDWRILWRYTQQDKAGCLLSKTWHSKSISYRIKIKNFNSNVYQSWYIAVKRGSWHQKMKVLKVFCKPSTTNQTKLDKSWSSTGTIEWATVRSSTEVGKAKKVWDQWC